MSGIMAAMLIVICTDTFSTCKVLDSNVNVYQTAETCEAKLIPSLRSAISKGEQIFGKCVSIQPTSLQSNSAIYWEITEDGDFLVDVRNDTGKANKMAVRLDRLVRPSA